MAGSTPGVFDGSGMPCPTLDQTQAHAMVAAGTARDGMVAKLRAGLEALEGGVTDVRIVDGRAAAYTPRPPERPSCERRSSTLGPRTSSLVCEMTR